MQLIEDTRNKVGKHKELNDYLEAKGHKVFRSKLLVGDYSLTTNQSVCIDTKADLLELCTNVCGKEEHERFRGGMPPRKRGRNQAGCFVRERQRREGIGGRAGLAEPAPPLLAESVKREPAVPYFSDDAAKV